MACPAPLRRNCRATNSKASRFQVLLPVFASISGPMNRAQRALASFVVGTFVAPVSLRFATAAEEGLLGFQALDVAPTPRHIWRVKAATM